MLVAERIIKIRAIRIDVKDEYKRKFSESGKEKFIDYIFEHKLFPQRIYLPSGASIRKGYLSFLLGAVGRARMLQNQGEFSLERLANLSFGEDLIIKNEDDIFEEKGEIVITQCGLPAHSQADYRLLKLYPQRKPQYLVFDVMKIREKPYYVPIQAGFLRENRLRIEDTIPDLGDIVLKEEKLRLYPLFDEVFKEFLFGAYYAYLN